MISDRKQQLEIKQAQLEKQTKHTVVRKVTDKESMLM